MSKYKTTTGARQCDLHHRNRNEEAAARMTATRDKLFKNFIQFTRLEDTQLEPVVRMETIANRLLVAARKERERRVKVCPEGFEHLVDHN